MGMKDFFNNMRDNAAKKIEAETDPKAQREKEKQHARKVFERTTTAIKWAKKGIEGYNNAAQKVEDIREDIAEKKIKIADAAAPAAEKIDAAAHKASEAAAGAFGALKDKLAAGKHALDSKIADTRANNAKKPSTGSSLLDFISPAVPETDETKPAPKNDKKKSGPKP